MAKEATRFRRSRMACQKCRSLKHKCDFNYPSCSRCARAKVRCLIQDPLTKDVILRQDYSVYQKPRDYNFETPMEENRTSSAPTGDMSGAKVDMVAALMSKVAYYETLLGNAGLLPGGETGGETSRSTSGALSEPVVGPTVGPRAGPIAGRPAASASVSAHAPSRRNLALPMNQITMLSMIPFRVAHPVMEREIADATVYGNTLRSQAGDTDPLKQQADLAPLPSREVTELLISNYFRFAWTQHPLIESREFLGSIVNRVYGLEPSRTDSQPFLSEHRLQLLESNIASRDMFLLYVSLAIGSAITAESDLGPIVEQIHLKSGGVGAAMASPEGYYLTSTYFLSKFFESIPTILTELETSPAVTAGNGNISSRNLYIRQSLEVHATQSLLLLCTFGLLKPVTPGIWYIISSAVKLCVDLDLHQESTIQRLELTHDNDPGYKSFHRRLFWSAYCLDRQICSYVNKPFSLGDYEISTQVKDPSYEYNLKGSEYDLTIPSFFVRLRKLQSQLQVVHRNPEMGNPIMEYGSLNKWTLAMHTQLNAWLLDCLKLETCSNLSLLETYRFSKDFLLINYFQLIQTLYKPGVQRKHLSVEMLGLLFEISYQLADIYERLFESKKINYKYLSVHSIHQAGIGLFYALINSPVLCLKEDAIEKSQAFIDKVLKMVDYLKESCPPAENVAKILVSMFNSTKELVSKRQAAARKRQSPGSVSQKQRKPSGMLISELLSPSETAASASYYDSIPENYDANDPSTINFGVDLDPQEFKLFIETKAVPIPEKRGSSKRYSNENMMKAGSAVKHPLVTASALNNSGIQSSPSNDGSDQGREQNQQIGEFFRELMSDADNGLSVNLHSRIQPPVFSPQDSDFSPLQDNIPMVGAPFMGRSTPTGPYVIGTDYQNPVGMQPPLYPPHQMQMQMAPPVSGSFQQPRPEFFRMAGPAPDGVSSEFASPGMVPVEYRKEAAPGNDLEVADIQGIWESLFDQPLNLKETMLSGRFV
ncbi:unnamed protein product [Kuraishia capsulata CBS 1993]|uniref:Zn(2)-C6 fungal-type domain-containing protein n=1 Tax=Kuraishia capsulata CBS 1993 TaxID=1382522 RepID=W6MNB3_9ASCO|nr:uncharacterized protein KUCA_T00004130001 [Kuraishia capsulata CBS 1993]CDK28149.1 unnamed protein product [Kuraishia capsulata CBS 1993]